MPYPVVGDKPWTKEEWESWRAENRRLVHEGWKIGTRFMLDGSIEEYAEKDGVEIRRDPKWIEDQKGPQMKDVTADEVKAAVEAAGLERIDHHDCAGCGYMTAYVIKDGNVFFDAGCDCSRGGLSPYRRSSWDDIARYINMQTTPGVKEKLAAEFGFKSIAA